MSISQSLIVVALVASFILMLKLLRTQIEPVQKQVPSSVYERAVTWHQKIMQMSDPDKKMEEFIRWKKFVNSIPPSDNRF